MHKPTTPDMIVGPRTDFAMRRFQAQQSSDPKKALSDLATEEFERRMAAEANPPTKLVLHPDSLFEQVHKQTLGQTEEAGVELHLKMPTSLAMALMEVIATGMMR